MILGQPIEFTRTPYQRVVPKEKKILYLDEQYVIDTELITLKEACRYKLRSDCDGLLLNPVKFKTLTTLGDRSFAAAAPQLWNSLPYLIRSSRSVASFKKTLKTFFIS